MAPRRISSIHPAIATVLMVALVALDGFIVLHLAAFWPGIHARIVVMVVSVIVVPLVMVEIAVRARRHRGRQSPRP